MGRSSKAVPPVRGCLKRGLVRIVTGRLIRRPAPLPGREFAYVIMVRNELGDVYHDKSDVVLLGCGRRLPALYFGEELIQ